MNKGLNENSETIRDPAEIQNLAFNLLKSATDEIMIIFSTVTAFHCLRREGLLEILKQATRIHNIKARILVDADKQIKELAQKLDEEENKKALPPQPQIHIRHIYRPIQTRITTLIVDSAFSMAMEMRDDDDDTKEPSFSEAVGLSSYSNSESTISSYTSIFESIWIQSELEEQKRIANC